jgi:hypothetical protein
LQASDITSNKYAHNEHTQVNYPHKYPHNHTMGNLSLSKLMQPYDEEDECSMSPHTLVSRSNTSSDLKYSLEQYRFPCENCNREISSEEM